MPLRFVLDEHLRGGGLWQAIQRHNALGAHPLDTIRVGDPVDLPLGTADPAILLWAEREGRIIITRDHQTMPGHLAHHLQAGRRSPGIFLLRFRASLPTVITSLVVIAYCGDPVDYQDRTQYIPL